MTSYESSRSREVPSEISMIQAIQERRYDIVKSKLRNSNAFQENYSDPNEELCFSRVYMTGLEYAVYTNDWRMATIFFVHSADPSYNCFDGCIRNTPRERLYARQSFLEHLNQDDNDEQEQSSVTYEIHPAFKGREPKPGFEGLYCLVTTKDRDENVRLMWRILWLMEWCYEPLPSNLSSWDVTSTLTIVQYTRNQLNAIETGTLIWNRRFTKAILNILNSLSRPQTSYDDLRNDRVELIQVPNEVALNILTYVIYDYLTDTIWSTLQFISEIS